MRRIVLALIGLAGIPALFAIGETPAQAQSAVVVTACPASRTVPYPIGTLGMPAVDQNGNLCASTTGGGGTSNVNITGLNGNPPSNANPLPVSAGTGANFPVRAIAGSALTVSGCTVGTSSAQCLAAAAASTWIQVQNTSASAQIACSWSGTAALNSTGSFMLQPGQSASWGMLSSGVPTSALNCIASAASTPLYLEMH